MTLNPIRHFSDSGRQALEDYSNMLFESSYTLISELSCTAYITAEPVPFCGRFTGRKQNLKAGDKWADNTFDCAWFHITGKKKNADTVLLDCGGEGLVTDKNGNSVQSITCLASGFDSSLGTPSKRAIPLYPQLVDGDDIDFWIDCGANDLFGNFCKEARIGILSSAVLNKETRELAYDVQVLLTAADFGEDEEYKTEIFESLEKTASLSINEKKAEETRAALKHLLSKKSDNDYTYYAIGHAHLDLAWLWPIRESIRKGGRTFSTQLKNIERYPGYIFGASQAQLYTWVKNSYPDVYKRVKNAVKAGFWDVQGATWVEPDSNLISGESLVRQFFYGKKFYREEFGLDMKIFWVPDSFGYSACIPQVMKLADVPYFLTQKISWNTFNKFPYHSFYWKGLDGTEVLAHMLPEDTYNSCMRGDLLKFGEKNYTEREISNISMSLYGIGDGGAGPGYEHIERAKRYRDMKCFPKVKMSKSLDFFEKLDDKKTPYKTYSGELYLEKHQGTYTTRSSNKRFNRKCEFALRNYELISVTATEKGIDLPISHEELEEYWKEILLYQFHDILPGSSINRVYEECLERYSIIYSQVKNASSYLLNKIYPSKTAVNMNGFAYNTKFKIDDCWYDVSVPPMGAVTIGEKNKTEKFFASCTYDTIENENVKVTFENGFISSLTDKSTGRNYIAKGEKAAVISQYDDYGDCWDIEGAKADYIQTKKDCVCTYFKIRTDGAKAWAEGKYKVGQCEMTHNFYILDGDKTLYCDLDIDCKQKNSMLRMAFPVDVNTDECSFNIQFGHLKRKTTEKTSVELAQFEVSAQKFVDMSDENGGISFINDCKYGYRCKNGIIDLNLLRSPKGGPGENVDQGHHKIRWALLPHSGSLSKETYSKAYFLNNPIEITDGNIGNEEVFCFYKTTNENIIPETVKVPEDKNGIIVRFYNCSESEQSANISIDGYKMKEIVNINEETINSKTDGNLTLHGFELVNVRFTKE